MVLVKGSEEQTESQNQYNFLLENICFQSQGQSNPHPEAISKEKRGKKEEKKPVTDETVKAIQ